MHRGLFLRRNNRCIFSTEAKVLMVINWSKCASVWTWAFCFSNLGLLSLYPKARTMMLEISDLIGSYVRLASVLLNAFWPVVVGSCLLLFCAIKGWFLRWNTSGMLMMEWELTVFLFFSAHPSWHHNIYRICRRQWSYRHWWWPKWTDRICYSVQSRWSGM